MLLPLTTTLYNILRSVPIISKAFSKATFIKTSTPITIPYISLPPLSLILSFLATYLFKSGEYPCFGRARLTAVPDMFRFSLIKFNLYEIIYNKYRVLILN